MVDMKKKNKILLGIVIIIFVFAIAKDQVIKGVIGVAAKTVLGTDVSVGGLSLGIFRQRVVIKNLRVYNPQGFGKEVLLDIPKIDVSLDVQALARSKLHLKNVDVDLKQMLVEKNKEGKLNVDSLKIAEKDKSKAKPKEAMPMQIDLLKLNIGQVVFKDYQPQKPFTQVYQVNVKNKEYKNITSAQSLASLIIVQAMAPTAIKGAAIYGASGLAGVAFLPLAAAVMFTGKDSDSAELNINSKKVFDAATKAILNMGRIISSSGPKGQLNAEVNGHNINIDIKEISRGKSLITVSAKKLAMPKPEAAAGVLFEIKKILAAE